MDFRRLAVVLTALWMVLGVSSTAFALAGISTVDIVTPDTTITRLVGIDSTIVVQVVPRYPIPTYEFDIVFWDTDADAQVPEITYGDGELYNNKDVTGIDALVPWKVEKTDGSYRYIWKYKLEKAVGTHANVKAKVGLALTRGDLGGAAIAGYTEAGQVISLDGDRPLAVPLELLGMEISDGVGTTPYYGIGATISVDTLKAYTIPPTEPNPDDLEGAPAVAFKKYGATYEGSDVIFVLGPGPFGDPEFETKAGKTTVFWDASYIIKEGDFPDLIQVTAGGFLMDPAGNLGTTGDDVNATPNPGAGEFTYWIDGKKPTFGSFKDKYADATLWPNSGQYFTDGTTVGPGTTPGPKFKYTLSEDVASLTVTMTGSDYVFEATGAQLDAGLHTLVGADFVEDLKDGVTYDYTIEATDLAGNKNSVSATGVIYDKTHLEFKKLFPISTAEAEPAEAGIDTINTPTVRFTLSEVTDTLWVRYLAAGVDTAIVEMGTGAETVSGAQTITFDLEDSTQYNLTLWGRDLAGNETTKNAGDLWYIEAFEPPEIAFFKVNISGTDPEQGPDATDPAKPDTVVTGAEIWLEIIAMDADSVRRAVTYANPDVTLEAVGGTNIVWKDGDLGVTDNGDGTATLDVDGWVGGARTVKVIDKAAEDIVVTVTDAAGPYTGQSVQLTYLPDLFKKYLVTAPDTVVAGEEFTVTVVPADEDGNPSMVNLIAQTAKFADNYKSHGELFVTFSANIPGVVFPAGPQRITSVEGISVPVVAQTSSSLVISVRTTDESGRVAGIERGESDPITVLPEVVVPEAPDGPDTLIAEDWKGADGEGDQGGFVILTFDLSEDHDTVDQYRIYREVDVNYGLVDGNLAKLAEAQKAFIPWAKVDAVPEIEVMRVVVPTLDNVATKWAVAAERNRLTSAQTPTAKWIGSGDRKFLVATLDPEIWKVFDSSTGFNLIETELPDQMRMQMEAKERLKLDQMAALERSRAMIAHARGINAKIASGGIVSSPLTYTADAVKAVDDIAPAPVTTILALDTPYDEGGSVTVSWDMSADDKVVWSGSWLGYSFSILGVTEYNVYRKAGAEEFALVGSAGSGETLFVDETAVNGVHYTYTVWAADLDNEVDPGITEDAVAANNKLVDEENNPVYDWDGDNATGFGDFGEFVIQFGKSSDDAEFDSLFDLDNDGLIGLGDFWMFVPAFGRTGVGTAKALPRRAGINTDVSLSLALADEIVKVGEDIAFDVRLADVSDLRGYGFTVEYDAEKFDFVSGVGGEANLLNSKGAATPLFMVISDDPGRLVVANAISEGPTVEGEGSVAELTFRVKSDFEEAVEFDIVDAVLMDSDLGLNMVRFVESAKVELTPEAFELAQNFPNPFNPNTVIRYALPRSSQVRLQVYNVLGQVVRTLVDERQKPGRYAVEWDGRSESGQDLASGIYFYRIGAEDFQAVKRMLLLK